MEKVEIAKLRYSFLTNGLRFSNTDKELVRKINKLDKIFIFSNDIILLRFCSEILKNDKELVLELVEVNGNNLRFVKQAFKDNEQIVWTAIKSKPECFQYISKRLRENDKIVHFVLASEPTQIQYCSEKFKKDKELILKLLKINYQIFKDIHPSMKNDLNILNETWEMIKEKGQSNYINLKSLTSWLLENMGSRLSPYFENVRFDIADDILVKQMDSIFIKIILHNELYTELTQSQNIQPKKLKI